MTPMPAAIAGIAEGEHTSGGRSALELAALAMMDALEDCGLSTADVDGLAVTGIAEKFSVTTLAEYVGIRPTWLDSTEVGGASYGVFLAHAVAAISLGLANVVVLAYGSDQRAARRRTLVSAESADTPLRTYDVPYGPLLPISAYALAARRHMHSFGTTDAQLAEVAIAARSWAQLNPRAWHHASEPLTQAKVASSPMISSPLRRLDCCLVTDGSAAVVLTTLDRARHLRKRPVKVLGTGMLSSHRSIAAMPDLSDSAGRFTAARALASAGLTIDEIDVLEIYDSFTITVLLTLEALGVCGRGEAGPFVQTGRLGVGGDRPINTNGGGLAHSHPGIYGIYLLIEAVEQLRGEANARQLPRAETALCHATGGYLSTHSTVVLGIDQ
jgi:acetyl-CoA acetyltransferase